MKEAQQALAEGQGGALAMAFGSRPRLVAARGSAAVLLTGEGGSKAGGTVHYVANPTHLTRRCSNGRAGQKNQDQESKLSQQQEGKGIRSTRRVIRACC